MDNQTNENEIFNEDKKERALLISVDTGDFNAEVSMEELEELAKTAGAKVVGTSIQKRQTPVAATYIGKGALYEMTRFCENMNIDLIIADSELSPVQIRNLEDETNTRVIDRTTLILDIFAGRARSKEGKLQIELAQLKYSLPRLTGKGTQLSRLGGGIGTRGPGETKLESDKRHIRRRIQNIRQELDKVKTRREMIHERRKKNGALSVAIVGYTNAGKSTLMNKLTDAGVLQEDKLFATLDPTTRSMELPNGEKVLLTDTVGFIRKLPHNLIEAFKSTLEEAKYADMIIHVVDCSNDDYERHMATVYETLKQLDVGDKPIITLFNKCDKYGELPILKDSKADYVENISARTGVGIDEFLEDVERLYKEKGGVVVVASEGLTNVNGESIVPPIFKSDRAVYYGDVSAYLAELVIKKLGIKARSEKPGICGRASIALQSPVDRAEAILVGELAVKAVTSGNGGHMIGFKRQPGDIYQVEPVLVPLKDVMLYERKLPEAYINERGNDITDEFVKWCEPLIGGPLPEFLNFRDYI